MDADLYGYKWARDNVGQSGATIYRLYGKPDAPELFLKHGKGSVANDVTDEMVSSSLTDSLRSVVRLRRAVSAHSKAVIRLSTESGDNAGKNM